MVRWLLAAACASVGSSSSPSCGMKQYEGMACVSNSYGKSHEVDADACCARCSDDDQCAQWTFHSDSGKCYRASAAVTPSAKSMATCGVKSAPPTPAPTPPTPPTPTPIPPPTPSPTPPAPSPTPPPSPTPKGAPNVILMMADDMGWADVGYNNNGYSLTPNLDAMASGKNSIRFDHFYSGGAVCSPTRASVYSGRTPNRNCIWEANVGHLQSSEFTILEAAKTVGYKTAHFGKWHLGAFSEKVWNNQDGDHTVSSPGTHGADWWYATEHAIPTATPNCACFSPIQDCIVGSHKGDVIGSCGASKGNAPGVDVNYFYPDVDGKYAGVSAEAEKIPGDDSDWLFGKFEGWLNRTLDEDASTPFLALLWWHPPHKDFVATPELAKPYLDKGDSDKESDYLGSISGLDAAVGQVRTLLRAHGVAENTMLFFTSDNGALSGSPGGEKAKYHPGLRGYKHDLTEGGIRVPGILEYPAMISKNIITQYPGVTMDYLPTVLDILGVQHPHLSWPLDGTSLMPFIRGEVTSRTQPIGHLFDQQGVHGSGLDTPWQAWTAKASGAKGDKITPSGAPSGMSEPAEAVLPHACQISWRVDTMKLLGWRPEQGGKWQYGLFDMSQDPGENTNVAGQHAEMFGNMFQDMWKWAEGVYTSQNEETHCAKKTAEALV
jgi:arylsulfatase A-like enzyme